MADSGAARYACLFGVHVLTVSFVVQNTERRLIYYGEKESHTPPVGCQSAVQLCWGGWPPIRLLRLQPRRQAFSKG
jgi:hypothetical protein